MSRVPFRPLIHWKAASSPPPRRSIEEPPRVFTERAERFTPLEGNPTEAISTPVGSIHWVPLMMMPYGMVTPSPLSGSMAEMLVLPEDPSVRVSVTGTETPSRIPAPLTGSLGEAPVPSHPRLIVPKGERRVPFWVMVEAYRPNSPPAERGSESGPPDCSTRIDPFPWAGS